MNREKLEYILRKEAIWTLVGDCTFKNLLDNPDNNDNNDNNNSEEDDPIGTGDSNLYKNNLVKIILLQKWYKIFNDALDNRAYRSELEAFYEHRYNYYKNSTGSIEDEDKDNDLEDHIVMCNILKEYIRY